MGTVRQYTSSKDKESRSRQVVINANAVSNQSINQCFSLSVVALSQTANRLHGATCTMGLLSTRQSTLSMGWSIR